MEEDEEIELIDLLRVLWKWKLMIILLTLVCVISAGVISLKMPKIYEVSMILEPVVIDIDPSGRPIYLDSPSNIKSKIDSRVYNAKISKRLNADPKKLNLGFKTIQPKNSNMIEIRFETKDTSKGIQALSALFHELEEEYQHYVDSRKSELDRKMTLNQRQLDISAGEKKYLEKEIAIVRASTDRIIEERNMLIKKGGSNPDKLSLLIYINIIQQNMEHYNNLNSQLVAQKNNIEKLKYDMETLKIKSEPSENIKLIQPPQSSIYPIKPKKKLNVILAFVIGLMFSIFLAFLLEYLQKMRSVSDKP